MPPSTCGYGQSKQQSLLIYNITASYYSKYKVWATPYEVIHGEPFPDTSIVVPFGCAALILLDADDRAKFTSRCSLMIFLHYAVDHPLFTYAFFSPRTKRVLYRQDCIFLTSVFPMRETRVQLGLTPEGDVLVTQRSPLSVRDGCPTELSFDAWKSSDPLPPYNDDVSGFGLGSPNGNLFDEPVERLDLPVHFPNHPAFGPTSAVGVPIQVLPSGTLSRPSIHLGDGMEQSRSDFGENCARIGFGGEFDQSHCPAGGNDVFSTHNEEVDQSDDLFPNDFGKNCPNIDFVGQVGKFLAHEDRNGVVLFPDAGIDQSDVLFPPKLGGNVCLEDSDLAHGTSSEIAVAPDLETIHRPTRRRVNQRWVYEPRQCAPALEPEGQLLGKRKSKPPQRLTASRLGMVVCVVPGAHSHSTSPSLVSGQDASSAGPNASNRSAPLARGGTFPPLFEGLRESPGSPPPPQRLDQVESGDADREGRFSIRLLFPDRNGPTMIYPVESDMPVTLLRLQIAEMMESIYFAHLLVGVTSWTHDLLEHDGTISDRVFPGTDTPCPYLQRGSRVLVYLVQPGVDLPAPPVAFPPGLSSLDVPHATGGWNSTSSVGNAPLPRYLAVRRDRERAQARGQSAREREQVARRRNSGEREEPSLDELLRNQLAADALQSSSSVETPPLPRNPEVLSDREFAARRSRQDALFEGYRRVKRSRIGSRSRDPEQEAISALPLFPSLPEESTVEKLRREIREIKSRMREQWAALNVRLQEEANGLREMDPLASSKVTWLIPDDLLDSDEDDSSADPDPDPIPSPPVGDPPSDLPPGPFPPPDAGGSSLGTSAPTGAVRKSLFRNDFVGTSFFDGELGWCAVTAVGNCFGSPVVSYESLAFPPRLDRSAHRQDFYSTESDLLAWFRRSVAASACDLLNWTVRLYGPGREPFTPHELVYGKRAVGGAPIPASSPSPRVAQALCTRPCPPVSGRSRPLRPVLLSPRQIRRVMAARETLFKFGTFVPRNDREANASPEAARWKAGRDLEWLRLNEQQTFELDWDLVRMKREHPEYQTSDIGHLFYVYDYKYSGEHRIRLVFDGSRQGTDT